jgi:hypothetical protein
LGEANFIVGNQERYFGAETRMREKNQSGEVLGRLLQLGGRPGGGAQNRTEEQMTSRSFPTVIYLTNSEAGI